MKTKLPYMKNGFTLSSLFFLLLFTFVNAQKITRDAKNLSAKFSEDFDYEAKLKEVSKIKFKRALRATSLKSNATLRTATAIDTIEYNLSKATGLQALNINSTTSAQAVSQYFDAPVPMTISGTTFFAYKIDLTGGVSINVDVELYLASSDSIPIGAPLAVTSVAVDTSFGGGSLETLEKQAVFAPVIVSQPYVVVVKNISSAGIGMISNSYSATPGDGGQEWLCSLDLFGTWTRSYDVNVGGFLFDADFLVYPHVSYDITADFSLTPPVNSGDNMVEVNSNSVTDSILNNRFYNVAANLNLSDLSYTFDFGDGSPVVNASNASYTYATNAIQNVVLTDTLFGWTANFTDDITKQWSNVLSTDEFETSNISISPNPATNEFRILNTQNVSIQNIEIYDVLGKKVLETRKTTINTTGFYAGVYFVKIISDNRQIVKRVIIK